MALETLDHSPPPFFRQGLPAALRFALLSLMAIGLMVADHRLQVAVPVRARIATLLTPLQWASLLPGRGEVSLHGRTYPAPSQREGFLQARYGDSWRTPLVHFEWPWALQDD